MDAAQPLDSQGKVISADLPFLATKEVTFAGATANDPGDKDGTNATYRLFTVTGDVLVRVFAICKTDLVGAATLEVGVAGATASLLAQIADATNLDNHMAWVDATPAIGEGLAAKATAIDQHINQKVAAADITAGKIRYYCFWRPLSADGKVVAA